MLTPVAMVPGGAIMQHPDGEQVFVPQDYLGGPPPPVPTPPIGPAAPIAAPEQTPIAIPATASPQPEVPRETPAPEMPMRQLINPQVDEAAAQPPPPEPKKKPNAVPTVEELEGNAPQTYENIAASQRQLGELEAKKAGVLVTGEKEQATREAELNSQYEAMRAQHEQQKAADMQDLQQRWDQFSNASIDPQRLFHNQTTGQSIAAAISLALGGALQVRTGQPNPALAIINRAVDNDIDAQKMNMEKAGRALQMKQSLYQMNWERFHNEEAATLESKSMILKQIANKYQAEADSFQSSIIREKAAQLADQTNLDAAKAHMDALKLHGEEVDRRMQLGIAGGHLALAQKNAEWEHGGFKNRREEEEFKAAEAEKLAGMKGKVAAEKDAVERTLKTQNGVISGINGKPLLASHKDIAAKLDAKVSAGQALADHLNRLKTMGALLRDVPVWELASAKQKMDEEYDAAKAEYRKFAGYSARGAGQDSKDSNETFDNLTGGKSWVVRKDAALDSFMDTIARDLNSYVREASEDPANAPRDIFNRDNILTPQTQPIINSPSYFPGERPARPLTPEEIDYSNRMKKEMGK